MTRRAFPPPFRCGTFGAPRPEPPLALRGACILQITPRLDAGGVEAVTIETARFIAEARGRALVASAGGALEPQLAAAGGRLLRVPVDRRFPFALEANADRLARLIRREEVDLIHVRSRAPAFPALAAAAMTDRPVVMSYHGVYAAGSPLKRWYNAVMTRGDAVIANSAFTAAHIQAEHRLDPAKLVVIPEGIDTARFDPSQVGPERLAAARLAMGLAPDDTRQVLLLPARLTGWKGQALAMAALAQVRCEAGVVLVLAGAPRGPADAEALSRAAHAAGLAEQVLIPGPLADMPAALAAADLVLAPSTSPESFGRIVAESCAMGAVTLASDLGGAAEIIVHGKTGLLLPPGDAAAWARGLEEAFALSPEARSAIGAAARARVVEQFDLAGMKTGTINLYRRLLGIS